VADLDRNVPPPPPVPAQPVANTDAAATPARKPLAYQSYPKAGGAVIDMDPDGGNVHIRITYHHDRAWPLVIGFGLMSAAATAKLVYDGVTGGRGALAGDGGIIAAAVLFALLALAASVRGGTPPLQLLANPRELRMHGGVLNETLAWRRDHVLDVSAEDLEQPHTNNRRTSVLVELRDEEYLVFPVATREEQAAVVQALRGALKLPPAGETRG
jgi:hypothetical protein